MNLLEELKRLRHVREVRLLAPLALAAGLLAVFIQVADDILEGESHAYDTAILLAFRTDNPAVPIGPWWLTEMVGDFTALGGYAVLTLFSLIAIGYLLVLRRHASACLVVLSGVGGTLLNQFLKQGFDRPRPDLVAHLTEVHTLSFPSGHAMLSAVIYLTLGVLLARSHGSRRLKAYIMAVAILLTMLVGTSRIFLGVHWPSDVLAGWCLGGAWAILCLLLVRYLARPSQSAATPASHIREK